MRVLTYPSLFPSSTAMSHGIFIYQRMSHFACPPGNSVSVVAPVPYAAYWIGAKATAFRSIPQRAKLGGFVVYHPRYLLLPKISMILHALLMYPVRPVIRKTRKRAVGNIGVCTPLRDAMVDCGADPNASVTIGNAIDIAILAGADVRGATDARVKRAKACSGGTKHD